MSRFKYVDLIVPLLYSSLVIFWSVRIPFNAAPDEYSHFFLVEYLFRFHAVPQQWVNPFRPFRGELTGAIYHSQVFWYYGMPNLHSFGAATTAAISKYILYWPASYLAARAFNWLLAAPFILALKSSANTTLSWRYPSASQGWSWCGALLVALIPQVTFIFSYLNSDAFGVTALSLTMATFLRLLDKPSHGRAVAVGAASGIFFCVKLYFLPASILLAAIGVSYLQSKGERPSLPIVLTVLCTSLLVCLPILLASWSWYGDAFGMKGQQDFAGLYGADPKFMRGTCFAFCSTMLVNVDMIWWWVTLTFKSFFFSLGWLDLVLPVRAYQLFFIPASLTLFISTSLIAIKSRFPDERWVKTTVIGFWTLLGFVALSNLVGSQELLPQPQGRYLFAVLPFIAILFVILLEHFRSSRLRVGLAAACLCMLAFNIYGGVTVSGAHIRPFAEAPGFAIPSQNT